MAIAFIVLAGISVLRHVQASPAAREVQKEQAKAAAGAIASTVSLTSTSAGKEFWMAFPRSTGFVNQSLIVYVAGREAATGRISIRDNTFAPIDFAVTPGQVTKLELPGTLVNKLHPANARDGVSDKGIYLTATADVNVYGLDYEGYSVDAYQAIPSHATGKDHIVSGYLSAMNEGRSKIVVVAQEDDTQITVTVRANEEEIPDYSGYPDDTDWANPWPVFVYTSTLSDAIVTTSVVTAMLNAGQVYQHTGTGRYQDLSGSEVQASKPVVVLGHVGGAYVPMARGYADQLLETMPPVSTWGKRYIGMPSVDRNWGDTFRIYASEADTTIRVNGGDAWNIGRGQWIEYRTQLTDTKYFVADKPIMVQQYLNGTEMDNLPGDPSMLTVAPLGQGMTSYTFATPKDKPQTQAGGLAEYTNTVNVLVPDVAGAAVYVDGVRVTGMTAAQDSGFLYASVSITPGTHTATGTVPFQVTVYGLRKDESYAYAAGSSYVRGEDISAVSVTPEGEYVVLDGARCFTATALSSASPVSGATAFLFDGYGKVITAGVTNAAGEIAACYTGQPGERGLTALVGPVETTANVYWKNDDADLISMTLAPGELVPAFVSTTLEYTAAVANAVSSVLVTPTLSDPNATYTITGSLGVCTPATAPASCALVVGVNTVTVTVTAEDGSTTKEYPIRITRAAPEGLLIDDVWPRTGVPAGGMPVAILGSGFTGATGVTVDGQSVPYTVTNDGRIDIVMPPGTDGQRVDIAVTTAAGTAMAVRAFTYVAPAVFEVDASTGGVVTATGGVTVAVPAQPGVSGTLRITVEAQPPAVETPGTLLMHSFVVTVTLNGQPLGLLGEALTLTLEVDPAVVPNGETPTLYFYGPPTAVWVRIPQQSYAALAGQVRGSVVQPGRYVVSTVLLRTYWFPIMPVMR